MSRKPQDILTAKQPEDVFGEDDPRAVYHALARQVHPDVTGGDEETFKALQRLWTAAQAAIAKGTYGKRESVPEGVLVTTKRHAYRVDEVVARGQTATVYHATYTDDSDTHHALLKVVRNPRDGEALAHEAKVLKELLSGDTEIVDTLAPYLPAYIEAFGYRSGKKTRQALAFSAIEGLVPLSEVREAYPNGVHPKDSAWMLRRLLLVLGLTHALHWAHGQVNESHILIHPEEHGLVLVDWSKAVHQDNWTALSAKEDIVDALGVVKDLTDMKQASVRLQRFYTGCLDYPQRLPDALQLREEFTELIEELWGARKFRPFAMPNTRRES